MKQWTGWMLLCALAFGSTGAGCGSDDGGGGSAGTGGATGGSAGSATGGSAGMATGGSAGSATGGTSGWGCIDVTEGGGSANFGCFCTDDGTYGGTCFYHTTNCWLYTCATGQCCDCGVAPPNGATEVTACPPP